MAARSASLVHTTDQYRPSVLSVEDIDGAAARIDGRVRRTPVVTVETGAAGLPAAAVLKLEFLQHTGSFKPRGVFNLLLSRESVEGVVVASGGNAGLAVAYACQELGRAATVFVPSNAPAVKVDRIRQLGAQTVVGGDDYAHAYEAAFRRVNETGELMVHAYDGKELLAGQGTLARELEEQAPDLDTVLVAVGGGGLVGGISSWYAGRVRVVAVEPERAPTLHAALAAGEPVDVEVGGIAADSLGARRIGDHGLAAVIRARVESVLVTDAAILEARRRLWQDLRLVTESGGATALAALTSGVYVPQDGERVGVVLCGGNTDPVDLSPSRTADKK